MSISAAAAPTSAQDIFDALDAGLRVVYRGSLGEAHGTVVATAHGCDCAEACQYGPARPTHLEVAGRQRGVFDTARSWHVELVHVRPGSFVIEDPSFPLT